MRTVEEMPSAEAMVVGGITVKMTLYSNVRRRICTFAMGLGFAVGATQSGEAQTQNVAQQRMAQSLIALCQTPNLNPTGLGNLCAGLTALANTPGQQAALNVALQQLNGGAELLNPISQPSLLRPCNRANRPAWSRRDCRGSESGC